MADKIIGKVERIYDNRSYQGQPSKYPKYVIFVKDQNNIVFELLYYSNNNPPCKVGDKVSARYWNDNKGRPTVSQDKETKVHMFQVIPEIQTPTPVEEIPLDDDLSNHEPDHFANNGVVDNSPTSFNYGANVKKPVDQKSLEMFCMAMAKSALESNQLKADKTSIANFIKDMVEVYKQSF
jgi:hypothetical protein